MYYVDVLMKKLYHFRLNPDLVSRVDVLGGVRTHHIEQALQMYTNDVSTMSYNRELVDLLNRQVDDLKQDKRILQDRVDYLMLPWYKRLLLPVHKQK